MALRNRYKLKINVPSNEDLIYHNNKVDVMMREEEEFWRSNHDEYNKFLNYETEENFASSFITDNVTNSTLFHILKPLGVILLIQYGVFVTIVWWNLNYTFV